MGGASDVVSDDVKGLVDFEYKGQTLIVALPLLSRLLEI
jgi:hypothetical protein